MSGAKARQAAADLLIETFDNRRTLDEAMTVRNAHSPACEVRRLSAALPRRVRTQQRVWMGREVVDAF